MQQLGPMQQIYQAIRAGDRTQVEALIKANPSLAIFAAAIMGDTAVIEVMLAANPSLAVAISPGGWTPLHLAAHFAKTDAVRALLNQGAQIDARSSNALRIPALHAAAAGRALEAGKLLLDRGANVTASQHSGWTALHAAAQTGDVAFARTLVEGGADVNIRADNQQRPLDLALSKGQQA